MQAINFVVRTPVGGTQSGVVSGEAGSSTIFLQENEQVSLHLGRHQMSGYARVGNDLVITLVDGREITLSGYFSDAGTAANRLFISSDGVITEVNLIDAGENTYFAQYSAEEYWGKWSPDDDLVFYDQAAPIGVADAPLAAYEEETVSMLGAGAILAPVLGGGGAALAAGGAIAGAALLAGGGSGSGTGAGTGTGAGGATSGGGSNGAGAEGNKAPATVANANTQITIGGDNTTEADETVTISGTGEPGATVVVEINGNTETTTVDPDGNWTVEFVGPTYPGDGEHAVTVTVTDPDGEVTELTGPPIVIDTTPPALDLTSGVVSTSDLHNGAGVNAGTTIAGQGEPGATVDVTIQGVSHSTVVDQNGNWSVTFDKSELAMGEYTTAVTIVTTDSFGNSATYTDNVQIDTDINAGINANLSGGDNTVNKIESTSDVAITGTADANSTITLNANGYTYTTTTDSNGSWTVNIPQGNLPTGETSVALNVTATDPAGNVTQTTGSLAIDTIGHVDVKEEHIEADGVINHQELQDGNFAVTGTAEIGTTAVNVTIGSTTVAAIVQPDGSWSATFPSSVAGSGEKDLSVTATAVDAAGNTSISSGMFRVDTYVNTLNVTDDSTGADNWVNASEMAGGLALSGKVEAGSQVVKVEHNGTLYNASVDPAGNWHVVIPSTDVSQGQFNYIVHATDAAGNTRDLTASVMVDTEAPQGPVIYEEGTRQSDTSSDVFLTRLFLQDTGDELDLYTIDQSGSVSKPLQTDLSVDSAWSNSGNDEIEIRLANSERVLDGTTLVVTAQDQAGNTTGTLLAWDQTGSLDFNMSDIANSNLNVETIDLRLAKEADLTLTEADIKSLSENTDQVTVYGGTDDSVTIMGATKTGTYTDATGHNFDVYDIGDARVLVDEDIQNVVI